MARKCKGRRGLNHARRAEQEVQSRKKKREKFGGAAGSSTLFLEFTLRVRKVIPHVPAPRKGTRGVQKRKAISEY